MHQRKHSAHFLQWENAKFNWSEIKSSYVQINEKYQLFCYLKGTKTNNGRIAQKKHLRSRYTLHRRRVHSVMVAVHSYHIYTSKCIIYDNDNVRIRNSSELRCSNYGADGNVNKSVCRNTAFIFSGGQWKSTRTHSIRRKCSKIV